MSWIKLTARMRRNNKIRNQKSEIRNQPAFTLIEMLVVMAIVGILAGLVGSAMVMARREAVRLECGENLHQIGIQLQSLLLADGSDYPALYENQNGDIVPVYGAGTWDGANGIPWWARLHEASAGAARLDLDDSTEDVLDLPNQIPNSMKLFHCRAAPALLNPVSGNTNAQNVVALDHSISYGLNFDVRRDDNPATPAYDPIPYECNAGASTLSVGPETLPNPPTPQNNRRPDHLRWGDIRKPAEFIIVSEADAENGTGGRIRCEATQDAGTDEAPIVARHGGKANVLFADNHVQLLEVTVDAMHGPEDVNQMTRLWTLPDD